jgi:hypothetical protein
MQVLLNSKVFNYFAKKRKKHLTFFIGSDMFFLAKSNAAGGAFLSSFNIPCRLLNASEVFGARVSISAESAKANSQIKSLPTFPIKYSESLLSE